MALSVLFVLCSATLVLGQRPFFAGSKPIGFPEVTTDGIGDRFGTVDGTTQRLPIEANGDRDLIERLSKLPIDKQPFWFINWQALEAHRQKPQTFPQTPNIFIDPVIPNTNSATANSNSETSTNSNLATSNSATSNVDSNSSVGNRFGNSNVAGIESTTTVPKKLPIDGNKKSYV